LLTEGGTQFYRPAVAGVWKSHIGLGTPRDSCPCGHVLDRNSTLLFRHFERRYTAFLPFQPSAQECLTVPFHIDGNAAGTLWAILHTDRRQFDAEDERLLSALVPFASLAVQTLTKSGSPIVEPDSRLMIDNIPTPVYTINPAGAVEFVNRQVVEYFGRTAEELKNWDKIGYVHPDDLPKAQASLRHSIEFGEPHEIQQRLRRADGVYRWFQSCARPQRDSNGRLVRWFAALTDIEDLKQSEEAVRAEANLRQILNSIPGLVVTMTAEGDLESANEQVVSYTGRTLEQLKDWATLLHPEDRTQTLNAWRCTLESGGPPDIEAAF
jgi:PAS domain S-box-containing protein